MCVCVSVNANEWKSCAHNFTAYARLVLILLQKLFADFVVFVVGHFVHDLIGCNLLQSLGKMAFVSSFTYSIGKIVQVIEVVVHLKSQVLS